MKKSDTITAKDGVPFKCPFCEGNGIAVWEPPCVLHSEPPCETFLRLDVVAFMREMNAARRRRN